MVEYASVRITQELKDRLDDNQRENETRNQQIERLLNEDSDSSEVDLSPVLKRLDDLETTIPNKVVEEMSTQRGTY